MIHRDVLAELLQNNNIKMSYKEVDNFVQKFKNLWKSGYDAHLDVDTCDGQAWVGLRVRLGEHPGHIFGNHHHARNRKSQAIQRRREKRDNMRKGSTEQVAAVTEHIIDENESISTVEVVDHSNANADELPTTEEVVDSSVAIVEKSSNDEETKPNDTGGGRTTRAEEATVPLDTSKSKDESPIVNPTIGGARSEMNYMCFLCDKRFAEMQILKDHMQTHNQIPQLDGHEDIRLRNPDGSYIVWNYCDHFDFQSSTERDLIQHKKKKHRLPKSTRNRNYR